MKKLLFLIFIFLIAILQSTILNQVRFFSVKPDLFLILTLASTLIFEPVWAIGFCIWLGFLKDTLGSSGSAINTIIFACWSLLIIKVSRKINLDNFIFCMILVFVAVIFNGIFTKIIFANYGKVVYFGTTLKILVFESIYTVLMLPVLFKLLEIFLKIQIIKE